MAIPNWWFSMISCRFIEILLLVRQLYLSLLREKVFYFSFTSKLDLCTLFLKYLQHNASQDIVHKLVAFSGKDEPRISLSLVSVPNPQLATICYCTVFKFRSCSDLNYRALLTAVSAHWREQVTTGYYCGFFSPLTYSIFFIRTEFWTFINSTPQSTEYIKITLQFSNSPPSELPGFSNSKHQD